jgi:DNA-binding MarR family transcriptional regulator
MNAQSLDAIIHAPGRLQICALLASASEAEFATLREAVGVSDSVMSKHLKLLEEAGYIAVRKAAHNGRQRTWIALTSAGRKAFAAHVAELNRLASSTLMRGDGA